MEQSTLSLIRKYNHSAIPDNHFAISELMNNVEKPFMLENKKCILHVRPVLGIHNIQLYLFWFSEEPLS
jgi:hypothetical protein